MFVTGNAGGYIPGPFIDVSIAVYHGNETVGVVLVLMGYGPTALPGTGDDEVGDLAEGVLGGAVGKSIQM